MSHLSIAGGAAGSSEVFFPEDRGAGITFDPAVFGQDNIGPLGGRLPTSPQPVQNDALIYGPGGQFGFGVDASGRSIPPPAQPAAAEPRRIASGLGLRPQPTAPSAIPTSVSTAPGTGEGLSAQTAELFEERVQDVLGRLPTTEQVGGLSQQLFDLLGRGAQDAPFPSDLAFQSLGPELERQITGSLSRRGILFGGAPGATIAKGLSGLASSLAIQRAQEQQRRQEEFTSNLFSALQLGTQAAGVAGRIPFPDVLEASRLEAAAGGAGGGFPVGGAGGGGGGGGAAGTFAGPPEIGGGQQFLVREVDGTLRQANPDELRNREFSNVERITGVLGGIGSTPGERFELAPTAGGSGISSFDFGTRMARTVEGQTAPAPRLVGGAVVSGDFQLQGERAAQQPGFQKTTFPEDPNRLNVGQRGPTVEEELAALQPQAPVIPPRIGDPDVTGSRFR